MRLLLSSRKTGRLAGEYWLLVLLVLLLLAWRNGVRDRDQALQVSGLVTGTVETQRYQVQGTRTVVRPEFQYIFSGDTLYGWTHNADYPVGAHVTLLVDPNHPQVFVVYDAYFWGERLVNTFPVLIAAILLFAVVLAVFARFVKKYPGIVFTDNTSTTRTPGKMESLRKPVLPAAVETRIAGPSHSWKRRHILQVSLVYWVLVLLLAWGFPAAKAAAFRKHCDRVDGAVTGLISYDGSYEFSQIGYRIGADSFYIVDRNLQLPEGTPVALLVPRADPQGAVAAGTDSWWDHADASIILVFVFAIALFRVFRISIRRFGTEPVILPAPTDPGRGTTRYPANYTE